MCSYSPVCMFAVFLKKRIKQCDQRQAIAISGILWFTRCVSLTAIADDENGCFWNDLRDHFQSYKKVKRLFVFFKFLEENTLRRVWVPNKKLYLRWPFCFKQGQWCISDHLSLAPPMLDGCKHKHGTHTTLVSNKASRPNLAWQVTFCGLQELKKWLVFMQTNVLL